VAAGEGKAPVARRRAAHAGLDCRLRGQSFAGRPTWFSHERLARGAAREPGLAGAALARFMIFRIQQAPAIEIAGAPCTRSAAITAATAART
jgi:hypothetical protein